MNNMFGMYESLGNGLAIIIGSLELKKVYPYNEYAADMAVIKGLSKICFPMAGENLTRKFEEEYANNDYPLHTVMLSIEEDLATASELLDGITTYDEWFSSDFIKNWRALVGWLDKLNSFLWEMAVEEE